MTSRRSLKLQFGAGALTGIQGDVQLGRWASKNAPIDAEVKDVVPARLFN